MAVGADHIELAPVVGEGTGWVFRRRSHIRRFSSPPKYEITGRLLAGGAGRKVQAARDIIHPKTGLELVPGHRATPITPAARSGQRPS